MEKLGFTVLKTASVLRQHTNSVLHDPEMPRSQGIIIHLIRDEKATSPIELAKRLALSRATVTQHLNELVQKGYVCKAPSMTDGRNIELKLTPKAIRYDDSFKERLLAFEKDLSSAFTAEEEQAFFTYLRRIRDKCEVTG